MSTLAIVKRTWIWILSVFICFFGTLVVFLIVAMLFVGWLLGQRRRVAATNDPYESGIVSVGGAQLRISVEFYLVAIFFVIFDLEAIFIFAYAVAFYELGWMGYISMMIFVVVLAVALLYGWLSGGLDWGNKKRVGLAEALERERQES